MGRVLIACVLLVAGCSATPPATTVSTVSPPVYRQPAYYPAPYQPPYLDPTVYTRLFPIPQPPQRVIVQQAPGLTVQPPAPTQQYYARPWAG